MENTFGKLGLRPALVDALVKQDIETPTEIQEKMIPAILEGKDVIGRSETGSGKTLAYLLPIFEKIDMDVKGTQAIILTPTHELAVQVLNSIPGYRAEFKQVFGKDGITIDEVTGALAAFEETLVTPNSRFDQWLKGDDKALTVQELAGYTLFKNSGCVACHNGVAVGGNSFQKMGLVAPYQTDNKAEGRAAVTGKDADRFNFKVPTLRNVALTYPYFHDGEAATLTQAVDVMGRLQLGRTFTPDENAQIVAFLKTLTGDQPAIQYPLLPPSADDTPRPAPFVK